MPLTVKPKLSFRYRFNKGSVRRVHWKPKTLLRGTKDLDKERDSLCSWTGRLSMVRWPLSPNRSIYVMASLSNTRRYLYRTV